MGRGGNKMSRIRTKMLNTVGAIWPVRRWASWKCRKDAVTVRRSGQAVDLQKENVVLRLSPKHLFFAHSLCRAFESFSVVLPAKAEGEIMVVDFAADPVALMVARRSLKRGVRIECRAGGVWLLKERRAMILSPSHRIYASYMAENFDLYFSPLIPQERDGLLVLDYSRPGLLQKYAKSGLEFELSSFPEEEDVIEDYFRWYRPQRGDLVFDFGAHCGVSTYHIAKLVGPEGKVIAFEPDPGNFALLERNIARHGLSNVVAENTALAGTSGQLKFNAEGTIASSLSSLLLRDSVGSTITVAAMTLEDTFAKWGVPAFCKLDIEGAEIEVVAASADVLRENGTNFALDTNHPQANGQMTAKEIERMFQSYGYQTFSEATPFLTTWARPKR
jgi:FkbM family methyltransferase